jgi:hypothetical protein
VLPTFYSWPSIQCKWLKSDERKKEYNDPNAFNKLDFKDKIQAYIQPKAANEDHMSKYISDELDSDSIDEESRKMLSRY